MQKMPLCCEETHGKGTLYHLLPQNAHTRAKTVKRGIDVFVSIWYAFLMRKPDENRNRAIVWLRKLDPKRYSWGVLAGIVNRERPTVKYIFERDVDKYPLPNDKSQ